MYCDLTKPAYHNFIFIKIIIVQANVTQYIGLILVFNRDNIRIDGEKFAGKLLLTTIVIFRWLAESEICTHLRSMILTSSMHHFAIILKI